MASGSYSISDIQDYFVYSIKEHKTLIDNLLIQIYINKIENRIPFRIKKHIIFNIEHLKLWIYVEVKKKRQKEIKIVTIFSHLELTEIVLIHWILVNSILQLDSRHLHTFIPNKLFGQLFDIFIHMLYLFKDI